MKFFDVVVAGGGSAGVSAALAAARSGCSTLLVERSTKLGGNVAHGLVHTICGLYEISEGGAPSLANGGIAAEFAALLASGGGASGPVRMGRLDVVLQEPEAFSALCHEMICEESNLTFWKETLCSSADVCSGRITSLEIRGRQEKIHAHSFIDATGDAALARLCGAETEKTPARNLQRPAYIFGIKHISQDALEGNARLRIVSAIRSAIRDGHLPACLAGATIRETCVTGSARITIDLEADGEAYNPFDEAYLEKLRQEAERLAHLFLDFLRTLVIGFERAVLFEAPSRLGIRESARIAGRYRLTATDILESAVFEDSVCVSAWPIEMRETIAGPRFRYPQTNRSCQIPLRALLSNSISNLIGAGRCISSTHEAHAALRVIGTGMAIGEAAGLTAAAIAKNPHLEFTEMNLNSLAGEIRKKTGAVTFKGKHSSALQA